MSAASGKKKNGIFKGFDITLITILSLLVAGIITVSGVLIWIVATL
jgi:hypothetical protein